MHMLEPAAYVTVPLGHAKHAVEPGLPEYVLMGHLTHTELLEDPACVEYVPAGHFVHVELLEEARISEYVPAQQGVHAALPCASEKNPLGHSEQVADEDAPREAENLPGVHFVHEELLFRPS